MSLTIRSRIGKKYAVHLPKRLAEAADLEEGEEILLRLAGDGIAIEGIKDPIALALKGWKFASVKPEEVEAVSLGEQERYIKGPP
ncbi:MAG: AbrB/MazE/SpoVT family DNA-binding domain-containing protein [Candidatus Bathyarchaeia archaeon]|nr:AbrB/MazE/SpoVT family DNA-binding domain-containing protein [Candidatus Bathyarchaeota archaeon]